LNIKIITDGGPSMGFGHIRRSTTLSWVLKNKGHNVWVKKATGDPDQTMPPTPKDMGLPDVIIIDLPYDGNQWVDRSINPRTKILGLDFSGSKPPDAIISIIDRKKAPKCLKRFRGLEYAIIRDDVLQRAPTDRGEGVIVCIGSGDQLGVGVDICDNISKLSTDVTLIEGPFNKRRGKSTQFKIVTNPANLADRMANCLWAVTNGGSLMMEMMCLGKAIFVVPQTTQEKELADFVYSRGALLGVGHQKIEVPDQHQIEQVSTSAKKLIDGKGVERITRIVSDLFQPNYGTL
jgi:spore coat polysaccharide biosynthesis predicted glycosyltransferase SpsG